MLYVNPGYVEYLDSYDAGKFTTAADSNWGKYIKRSGCTDNTSSYCYKGIDSDTDDVYFKSSFYYISTSCHAEVHIDVIDNGAKKNINVLDLYSRQGIINSNISSNFWFNVFFHFYFDSNTKVLKVEGRINGIDFSASDENNKYTNPKITGIYIVSSLMVKDIVITDFKINANDELIELPVSAHGGDFIANTDGGYELTDVEKTGTVSLDTSSIKTDNKKIIAASYIAYANRNNDDITDLDIAYAGQTYQKHLNDGSNVLIASFTNTADGINVNNINSVTITAKKV